MSGKKAELLTSAQLRALRDIKLADQVDPKVEARRHEASFLRSMAQAKEDFDWILANEAWAQLGFSTFADWWDERVAPLAASLGMRPTREIAKTVIEKVVEDQKDLPKAQQRSQREIAAMVGVSQKSVSRSLTESNDSTADLGQAAADPVDAMHAALEDIDAHLAGQAGQRTEDPTNEESDPVVPVAASSALPEAFGASSGSAPAEQEGSSSDSPPADERPQGDSGVSSPAAVPQPDEDDPERVNRELRTRSTQRFCASIVTLTQGIGSRDPAKWIAEVYLPGVYANRGLPRVDECFTPSSLKALAAQIYALADHLHETGMELK